MWQDAIFLCGSVLTALALGPVLRDSRACIPLGTSLTSAGLRTAYVAAFLSLGMVWSAAGVALVSTLWVLVALYRRPSLVDAGLPVDVEDPVHSGFAGSD
ncbi:hypothetical protein HWV07_04575 [Natronomonas salina]|uniref:hypothetical protein n=1 Tax=Natronomonas salina TaxID=1710540 RepID=UPI0015B53BD3|nr:hypothetical protein [Natronomonas salina]QLD88344.1 hypothetical protein HWV07_04575 [Natronomonas salina]